MNERFKKLTDGMPLRLQELLERPLVTIDDIGITEVPQKGVYVLFEDNEPVYVGRSNRLKERLKEHSRGGSEYSATLAFRIAKQNYSDFQKIELKQTSKQLMMNVDFVKEFEKAKDRIAKMRIRFIRVEDQIEQAMFEIYAHMTLGTKFNDFNTH